MSSNDIVVYNKKQSASIKELCELLLKTINGALPNATAKLYHANPVWFIDENPIVGYDVAKDHVNLLFWSGQSFKKPGLKSTGKFKAAGIRYDTTDNIDIEQLQTWLKSAQSIQWNYRDLRKNNGELAKM